MSLFAAREWLDNGSLDDILFSLDKSVNPPVPKFKLSFWKKVNLAIFLL